MKIALFSSFSFAYLDRARVLFSSLRRCHPDWHLIALIVDELPEGMAFDPSDEPFDELVYASEIGIPEFSKWVFKHDIVEACTAVKGPFLYKTLQIPTYDAVVYLDPDIAVFNPLDPVLDALKESDIVLTPHQLIPDDKFSAIMDNEVSSLKTGIYNLGFIAVRSSEEGLRFARWWSDRLMNFCYDDIPNGLFVDQRWCDHVPGFFDKVRILRDPGHNVASWNLSQRKVRFEGDGNISVNGVLLRFWHFTKLGPVGETMTKRYAAGNFEVFEIWNWYKRQVVASKPRGLPIAYWAYGQFGNGEKITHSQRLLYRTRKDLQSAFLNPFSVDGSSYLEWFKVENGG